jgi:predicted dehydrogenase
MNPTRLSTSRRQFIKTAGSAAGVSVLAGAKIPFVHAAETNTLEVGLVGCGGRGTGAALNALTVTGPPLKLVAMADVVENKLKGSLNTLQSQFTTQIDVPADRQFIGFDGFKRVVDSLRPGGIVILTTPPAFRWVHYKYAIEKGVNVFMEKPVAVDGPTTRRILALNEEAIKKGMKVAVGLMCRHCKVRKELATRVHAGEIGDLIMLRAFRMQGPVASFRTKRMPESEKSELLYQIKYFHSFLWASGGAFSDFFIHNVDEACWMKNALPVEVKASGGRHFREDWVDQNFDHYSVEYTFEDGAKFYFEGRNIEGCHGEFATYAHGTNGMAIVSTAGHLPAKSRIFRRQKIKSEDLRWSAPQPEPNPYQLEWDDFIEAIRNNVAYNEVKRGAEISLVAAMGRIAAHTGSVVTYKDALDWEHEFAPDVDKLTLDSPAPLRADADGKYPLPAPGVTKKREYNV